MKKNACKKSEYFEDDKYNNVINLFPKKSGRRPIITPLVIAKLEEAFSVDCSHEEACYFAGIDRYTLSKYIEENKDFEYRINQLKALVIFDARKSLCEGIKKDANLAWKFLERKVPEEFSPYREYSVNITNVD